MVAFLTPKRSLVDIVQATGRAMRKSPATQKTTGYVLVPLFLEQVEGETIEEAVARAQFDEVWAVLQALQEHDEVLAEIIRHMREERGRTKGYDDKAFRDRVEVLGPSVLLDTLRHSITTQIVDQIGSNWDERFGELVAFKAQHGHCNVPQGWSGHPILGQWVSHQRMGKSRLLANRRQRLDDIGFVWRLFSRSSNKRWDERFGELQAFKAQHGHCNVPRNWPENPSLATWVTHQRRGKDRLLATQRQQLEALGFKWVPHEVTWEAMFSALVQYKEQHGDCMVPVYGPENPALGMWVFAQRQRKDRLPATRRERLEKLGFVWNTFDTAWEKNFSALVQYQQQHGHCNVPQVWPENPALGTWVSHQRKKKGRLSVTQQQRLEALGLVWDLREAQWEEQFAALVQFKVQHGHCNVPRRGSENRVLRTWIGNQRINRRKGLLPEERQWRLEALGLVWDPFEAACEEQFSALVRFKAQHGHCNVPQRWSENPILGNWVATQREMQRQGGLPKERQRRLEALGLVWNPREAQWEEQFAALVQFKAQYGHCSVPQSWPERRGLGSWVIRQRGEKKAGRLSQGQQLRLEAHGFEWTWQAPKKADPHGKKHSA